MLADVAAAQRDLDALRQYAPRAQETAVSSRHVLYEGIAYRALGILHGLEGNQAVAEGHFRQALERFRTLDARWQLGRTYFEQGKLAAEIGDGDAAAACFDAAMDRFDTVGAVPDLERVGQALSRLQGR